MILKSGVSSTCSTAELYLLAREEHALNREMGSAGLLARDEQALKRETGCAGVGVDRCSTETWNMRDELLDTDRWSRAR